MGDSAVNKEFKGQQGALPGFPEAKYVGKKHDRDRWELPDKKFLDWDYRHGELEMFNKTGKKHLGAYDPYTGDQLKEGRPDRKAKP